MRSDLICLVHISLRLYPIVGFVLYVSLGVLERISSATRVSERLEFPLSAIRQIRHHTVRHQQP